MTAMLDEADAIRTKRLQLINHLDSLTQSIFRSMFSHEPGDRYRLSEVAAFFGGGTLPEGDIFSGQEGGALLMKVSDMNSPGNSEEIHSCSAWTSEPVPRSSTVDAGAVVLPKRGASIATNKKRITTRRTTLDPNLMGVRPRLEVLETRYLYEWFKSFDLTTISSGSTVPQLNKQDLSPLEIAVPPLVRQRDLAARISEVNDQRLAAGRALVADQELFVSLQALAFRNET